MEQEVVYGRNCVIVLTLYTQCSLEMYLYILVTVIPNIALGKLQILNTLQPLADFILKSYLLLYACSEFYNYCHPINF